MILAASPSKLWREALGNSLLTFDNFHFANRDMLFNSFTFGAFFVIVYSLYLVLNHKWQNRMLLVASYIFYGAWDWRFLSLILFSTVLDYTCGIKINKSEDDKNKRFFLFLSIFGNLSVLGFFKYFGFFSNSLQQLLSSFGISFQHLFLDIILPVGISFYTFQTMSYTIDIYRRKVKPTKSFFDYALYVAFFPQLVAGPIERAGHLLPQILSPRELSLERFYSGMYLIFWGLLLKMVIADNLARLVDPLFDSTGPYHGGDVLIVTYAFAFQIFCDFAGYSNIARGVARCLGFDIMVNFNLPYFVTNPREFWLRWHISLSSWLRDYLYIPLGGNRKSKIATYRNIAITMLLGGLWHGAAWKFVVWGAYHGALLIIHRILEPFLKSIISSKSKIGFKFWLLVRVVFFFHLLCAGWLVFRAQSIGQVIEMLQSLILDIEVYTLPLSAVLIALFLMSFLLIIQLFQYQTKDLLFILKQNWLVRSAIFFLMYGLFFIFGVAGGEEFIYFQF